MIVGAALSVIELAGALALFGGVIVTMFTIAEKLTGVGQRWLARGVEAGTRTLREDLNDVKADTRAHTEALAEVRHLSKYHLGPNDGSPKLHERVEKIERSIGEIRTEQAAVRHDLEEGT